MSSGHSNSGSYICLSSTLRTHWAIKPATLDCILNRISDYCCHCWNTACLGLDISWLVLGILGSGDLSQPAVTDEWIEKDVSQMHGGEGFSVTEPSLQRGEGYEDRMEEQDEKSNINLNPRQIFFPHKVFTLAMEPQLTLCEYLWGSVRKQISGLCFLLHVGWLITK